MRTVFIGAHEEPNGVNSYTYNLALELKKRGFESFVMSFGSCNKVTDYKGVKIKQYRTGKYDDQYSCFVSKIITIFDQA